MTTEPTRWSRISRATSRALASASAVTTPEVMISLRRTRVRYPSMSQVEPTHVVPLEAGAGPENPPCPACGEPLFGWIGDKPGLAGPVRRCESCGLGVVGDPAGAEEALRELDRLRDGDTIRIENRASFACSLGSAGWAGLQAWSAATCSRSSRCAGSSPAATRW